MDKLSEEQRKLVSKLSTQQLGIKLGKIGVDEVVLETMERKDMLIAWAEAILAGKDKPVVPAAEAVVRTESRYDVDLETRRLEFEMRRFEEERADRIRREEVEGRIRAEEREREERMRREDQEERALAQRRAEEARRDEVARIAEGKAAELAVRKGELERQRERDRVQREIERSVVHRTKMFGDAMRNSFSRMPNDSIELISYFRSVEQWFKSFDVPAELQAILLKPYFTDRARILVGRMDPDKASNYDDVKKMLLNEFKLSPKVYAQRYKELIRPSDETFVLFASRLKGLLQYYLSSRHAKSFDELVDLLLCDRIKETLTDTCLKHVLTVETSEERGWLSSSKLCETIDLYFANNLEATKARSVPVSAFGNNGYPGRTNCHVSGNNGYPGRNNCHVETNFRPPMKSPSTQSNSQPTSSVGIKNTFGRKCNLCQSEYHLANACPQRNSTNQNVRTGNFGRGGARINACSLSSVNVPIVTSLIENSAGSQQRNESGVVSAAPAVQTETSVNESNHGNANGNFPALGLEPKQLACPTDLSTLNTPTPVVIEIRDLITNGLELMTELDDNILLTEHFAKLRYVDVMLSVNNDKAKVSCLCDGGAEMCVIRSNIVQGWDLTFIGTVKLRGLFGASVLAKLVGKHET